MLMNLLLAVTYPGIPELVQLVVVAVVLCLIYWILKRAVPESEFKVILLVVLQVVGALIFCLWLLRAFGIIA